MEYTYPHNLIVALESVASGTNVSTELMDEHTNEYWFKKNHVIYHRHPNKSEDDATPANVLRFRHSHFRAWPESESLSDKIIDFDFPNGNEKVIRVKDVVATFANLRNWFHCKSVVTDSDFDEMLKSILGENFIEKVWNVRVRSD